MTSVVVVANLKGGTGKTTTSVFLAHAWAAKGRSVLLVDADPQGSALSWSQLATWPFPALALAVGDLHTRLPGIVGGDRYDVVVIDTPPMQEQAGIVQSAMRAATDVVIPVAPTMIECDRLLDVWAFIDGTSAQLRKDEGPATSVLFTRTSPNAGSTRAFRNMLTSDGDRRVLHTAIPRRELYAQAYGAPVKKLSQPYIEAADEILPRKGQA